MDQEECQIVKHISTGFVWPGRTNGWWLGFHQNRVPPSEWKENFRMSRESFLVLCTELNDHIVKSSIRFSCICRRGSPIDTLLSIRWRSFKKNSHCFWSRKINSFSHYSPRLEGNYSSPYIKTHGNVED